MPEQFQGHKPLPGWLRWLGRQMIPNIGTVIVVVILLWATNAGAAPWSAPLQAPGPGASTINYQGRLADSNGAPVPDGTYTMQFTIYDSDTGDAVLWGPETQAVPVTDGLFSAGLGSAAPGGVSPAVWNGGDRYLEINVNGETLSPRELLRGVPYAGVALQAQTALSVSDGAITTSKLADGAVTNEKVGLDYWKASTELTHITSNDANNPDEIISLDVDFPTDGLYLIFAKVVSRADGAADQQVIVEIWDENDNRIHDREGVVNTHPTTGRAGRQTGTFVDIVPFSAREHTIRLMAFMLQGQTGGFITIHTVLTVIPFAQP